MISADAIKELAILGLRAGGAQVIRVDADPKHIYLWVNGEISIQDVPPGYRSHGLDSLDGLVAYLLDYCDGDAEKIRKCVIWHDSTAVTAVLDDEDRRDQVRFDLTTTERFRRIVQLQAMQEMDHRVFLDLLKIHLGLDETLVEPFRRINFETLETGVSKIERSTESLGREMAAKTQGMDNLPKVATVETRIYREPGEKFTFPLRINLDPRPGTKRFLAYPFEQEVEQAIDAAQENVRNRLLASLDPEKGWRVYRGRLYRSRQTEQRD